MQKEGVIWRRGPGDKFQLKLIFLVKIVSIISASALFDSVFCDWAGDSTKGFWMTQGKVLGAISTEVLAVTIQIAHKYPPRQGWLSNKR